MTLRPLLLLLALAACKTDEVPVDTDNDSDTEVDTTPVDSDNDGVPDDQDCAPNDAAISPNAAEVCNGIDDNCDEQVDEGVLLTFYQDTDGDGFGTEATTAACGVPEGYAEVDGDCDDALAEVNPDATELCNGIDDNCDEQVDEGVQTTFYVDSDLDGYGADSETTDACEAPEGFAATADDCDDTLPAVNPGATEVCNGIDDNCNEATDEGALDTDADGVLDCFDDSCELVATDAGEVDIDETCAFPQNPIEDAFNVVEEWTWSEPTADGIPVGPGSAQAPLIAHLQDSNGDDIIDTTDIPVILMGSVNNTLYALSGDSGELLWQATDVLGFGNQALADVDDDGELEIIAYDTEQRLIAIETDGSERLWTAAAADTNALFPVVSAADIDGDGTAELLGMAGTYESETGALSTTITMLTQLGYFAPTSADLDGNGTSELIYGHDVFDLDGTHLWSTQTAPVGGGNLQLLWNSAVNLDADPDGELIALGGGMMGLYDSDGTQLAYHELTEASQPGPPCVGDYDGDGQIEVAWSSGGALVLFELNGQLVWSVPAQDSSGAAGCSAYDLDADGHMEVLFASENSLVVVDGSTGAERYRNTSHASGTLFEWPTIADVDGDGSAEFVYVSNTFVTSGDYPGSLHVVGHVNDGWYSPGTSWLGFNWGLGGQAWDGSFPEGSDQQWNQYNLWRALPSSDTAASNLVVSLGDQCLSSCDSDVGVTSVEVIVSNTGSADIDQTFEVTLLVDDGESSTPVDSVFIDGIAGGASSAGLRFDVPIDVAQTGDLRFEADLSGAVVQCSEDGDIATWAPPSCSSER